MHGGRRWVKGDRPQPRHAALDGVKVVDLSQVLAGPTGGRTLAEFGADVVKINPPGEEGAGIRLSVHRYHTDVNRGKRTMLLDLKKPGALDVMWRLLDDTDVVVHNFRPGVMERLGIGYEEVSRRRPGIIYIAVTAYGAGPWGTRPGYEGFGQASTGMAARQGGDARPLGQPFAVNDYGTGLSSAFAATLALYYRERTGQGQQGAAALAYTGTILQSPYLQQYEGKKWDEPAGPAARGFGPLQALYRAADGWFYLGADKGQLAALASIEGLGGIEALTGDALMAALDARFLSATADAWCERLVARGIGAHRLVGMPELMSDPWVIAHGLSVTREHDTGEVITTVGPSVRMSGTPADVGRAAASPGADGLEVLASIGLADRGRAARSHWRVLARAGAGRVAMPVGVGPAQDLDWQLDDRVRYTRVVISAAAAAGVSGQETSSLNARTRFNATATDCARYGREKRTALARSTVRETEDTATSTSPAAT